MNINKLIDLTETLNQEVTTLKDSDISVEDILGFFNQIPYPNIESDIKNRISEISEWITGEKKPVKEKPNHKPLEKHPGGQWNVETRYKIIDYIVNYCDGMSIKDAANKIQVDLGLKQSPKGLVSKQTYKQYTDGIFEIVRGKIKVNN